MATMLSWEWGPNYGYPVPMGDGVTSQPKPAQLRYQAEVSPCRLLFYSWFSIGDRRCGEEEEKLSAVCRRRCHSSLSCSFVLIFSLPSPSPLVKHLSPRRVSGGDASRLSYQDAISVPCSSRVSYCSYFVDVQSSRSIFLLFLFFSTG